MGQQIPHLYVAESAKHGRGVFAGTVIDAGSIIEICPILYLPAKDIDLITKTIIHDYYFEWGPDLKSGALALGFGSIYNHSFEPNAYYDVDMEHGSISVFALRDIEAGEELTFNYNGSPSDDSPLWFETV